MQTKPQPAPENIRAGAPYDNPAFESLCREMGIWGTAQAALGAVFWRAGSAKMAESIGAGGVSALMPARRPMNDLQITQMLDGMSSYCGEWEAAIVRATEARHGIA